ncbi:MAPK/MAK/MRK overlapping kinase isoform 2-T2 [Theristicus caerulescens]
MHKYKPVGKIGEGTFSDVLKTLSLRDGKYYACKHMKQHFESMEQVNNLREIQVLRRLSPHPNILTLHEVVFDKKAGSLSLICELMDMNIYELIKGRRKPLPEKKIKNYMYQLCRSLDYIHRNGIFHRDVKPENILIKRPGRCVQREMRDVYWKLPDEKRYSLAKLKEVMDSFQPLFPGSNELDQISKIHDVIGTPANKTLHKFKQSRIASFDFPFKKGKGIPPLVHNLSPKGFSLLYAMIKYDPDERIAAHQALQHPYFQELWAADTQALAMHKKLRLLGNTAGQVPLRLWQISKKSQRQHSLRKVQEKPKQQHGPPRGELPKLNLSGGAKLTSCPPPTLHSVFRAPKESGGAPVLQSVRFIGSNIESEKQKALKSSPKHFHLPAIERRGGY